MSGKRRKTEWMFWCASCKLVKPRLRSLGAKNAFAHEHSLSCPGKPPVAAPLVDPEPQTPPKTPQSTSNAFVEKGMETPATEGKRVLFELVDNSNALSSVHAELTRLKAIIAENERFRRQVTQAMADIHAIHDGCDKVRNLHETLRTKRGSATASRPDVAIAPVLEYFRGLNAEKQDAVLTELLSDLASTSSLAMRLNQHLEARAKFDTLCAGSISHHILVDGNLFDNLTTGICQNQHRITEKWLLEFVRMNDLSRLLSMKAGANAMKGFRYSPLVKSFCGSLRFNCTEATYKFAIAHPGNDPDSTEKVNLLGLSNYAALRDVRMALKDSKPGFIDETRLTEVRAELSQLYPGSDHLFCGMMCDMTDLQKRERSKGVFSGEGESIHGGLSSDGIDRPDRLQWATTIHELCGVPADKSPTINTQIQIIALIQCLEEINSKARAEADKQQKLLVEEEQKIVEAARKALIHTTDPLPENISYRDLMSLIMSDQRPDLSKFRATTYSMARVQSRLSKVDSIQTQGSSYVSHLQHVVRQVMPIAHTQISVATLRKRLREINEKSGKIALFDIDLCLSRWDQEKRRQSAGGSPFDATLFKDLPEWWERCYDTIFRVDADQVGVVMIRDLKRMLPPIPVARVYAPKLGFGNAQHQALLDMVADKLAEHGIHRCVEITDGALNGTRNERKDGVPTNIFRLYHQQRDIAKTYDKEQCIEVIRKEIARHTRIEITAAELDEIAPASGLCWEEVGARKPILGRDRTNTCTKLTQALVRKTVFTVKEWEDLGVRDLQICDFVKAGGRFFQPSFPPLPPSDHLTILKSFESKNAANPDFMEVAVVVRRALATRASDVGLRKKTNLTHLRTECAVCTVPGYKIHLKARGVAFDERTPADLADTTISIPEVDPVTQTQILKSCCHTHIFKSLRMAIAHGSNHAVGSLSHSLHQRFKAIAQEKGSPISPCMVDGIYPMSVPVAMSVLSPDVAECLRGRAAKSQGEEAVKLGEAADFADMCNTYWRACDETGIIPAQRIAMLKEVKRYFLRDLNSFFDLPAYVNGIVKGTWVQLMLSIEVQMQLLDPTFLQKCNVSWVHHRLGSQDDVERLFAAMTKHRTLELFESKFGWAVLETCKLFNEDRGFHKSVSTRKSRILDRDDDSLNPHIQCDRNKRSLKLKRALCDPANRGDMGQKRNKCRDAAFQSESSMMSKHDRAILRP
jgi:hypothetical protein